MVQLLHVINFDETDSGAAVISGQNSSEGARR